MFDYFTNHLIFALIQNLKYLFILNNFNFMDLVIILLVKNFIYLTINMMYVNLLTNIITISLDYFKKVEQTI